MTDPQGLPPLTEDAAAQIERLGEAIRHLFPDADPGHPVDQAIGLLTQYALDEIEAGHLIDIQDTGWAIRHPLVCRPAMFDCSVHLAVTAYYEATRKQPVSGPGIYRVTLDDDGLTFSPYEDQEPVEVPDGL